MFMFDEFMPDCVPELYRSRQEAVDRRYDLQARHQAQYDAIASGLHVLNFGGYGPCWDCRDADHDTMTDDDDDMCRVICRNPACPHHNAREVSQ